MTPERLQELINRFKTTRVAVVGDFFLDKYLDVDPGIEEVSLETDKPAHQVVQVRCNPGAAGTVVNNLAALGAGTLHAVGVIGNDGEGYDLRAGLERLGCQTSHLHGAAERYTPTYLKPRRIGDPSLAGEHERYDTKNRTVTPADLEAKIIESVDALLGLIDALIVMDQVEEDDCGVLTRTVRDTLCERAREHPTVIFWADSRRRIDQYRHVVIKPNQFEVMNIESPDPDDEVDLDDLKCAIERLRKITGAPICATRGWLGCVTSDPQWTVVPGVSIEGPTDSTGAGDSTTAGAVLALCAGASLPEAALLGNLVASMTVQQLATTGVARPEELPNRLAIWAAQQDEHGR